MTVPPDQPNAGYYPQWERPTRLMMTVFLIVGGVYALTLLAPVIQMLAFAFLLAFAMFTPSRALTRRLHIPWAGSVVIVYLLLILVVLGLLLVFIPGFVDGVNTLLRQIENAYQSLLVRLQQYQPSQGIVDVLGLGIELDMNPIIEPVREFILGGQAVLPEAPGGLGIEAPPTPGLIVPGRTGSTTTPALTLNPLESVNLQQIIQSVSNVAGTVTDLIGSLVGGLAGFFSNLLLAVFVSFLVMIDLPHTYDNLVKWIPQAYHREYALLLARVRAVWNGFFRGQVFIGIVIGLLTWVQLTLMGVPGATILAIFTAVISLIPTIGGFIALLPLSIVPLLQGSLVFTGMSNVVFALLVVGVNLLISQGIWNVVAPKILGDALDLPLPVIIVGVFIGAAVGGVLGAFLVAPIMSTLRVIIIYIIRKIGQADPFPGEVPAYPLTSSFFDEPLRPTPRTAPPAPAGDQPSAAS